MKYERKRRCNFVDFDGNAAHNYFWQNKDTLDSLGDLIFNTRQPSKKLLWAFPETILFT